MKNINILIAVFLVVMVATARVINADLHLPNFVPIAAISLFSGAILKDKRAIAFLVPLLGQFLADLYFQLFTNIPGFYGAVDQLFTYSGLIAATALGVFFMKQQKPLTILGFTLGASFTFFLLSNFGYFVRGANGHSISGFIKTYVDAIPFYQNSFLADIAGAVLLFGGYALTRKALNARTEGARA